MKYGVKRNWKVADKLLKKENNSVIFFFWGRIRAELNNLKLFHHYKIAVRMIIKRVEVNISRLTSSSSCHKEFKPCIKCSVNYTLGLWIVRLGRCSGFKSVNWEDVASLVFITYDQRSSNESVENQKKRNEIAAVCCLWRNNSSWTN